MLLEKIKKLCEQKGISIARLEKEAGIGNGTIGRWDSSKPNIKTLESVASVLCVSISELLE